MIFFVLTSRPAPEHPPCAVVGCCEPGRPHLCPYDGTQHGHGRIHYNCHGYAHFAPGSSLTFHDGDWRLLCDAHHRQVLGELAQPRAAAS